MLETFPIVPAPSRSLWLLLGFLVALFTGIGALLVATARGATRSRFDVSAEGVRLRGDFYGRLIPSGAIRSDSVRVVDLAREPALRPTRRTMGTAIGGYQSGWFRLANGEEALLYLTDRRQVVYIPTTAGYSLLLSAQAPDRMVERVRHLSTGG